MPCVGVVLTEDLKAGILVFSVIARVALVDGGRVLAAVLSVPGIIVCYTELVPALAVLEVARDLGRSIRGRRRWNMRIRSLNLIASLDNCLRELLGRLGSAEVLPDVFLNSAALPRVEGLWLRAPVDVLNLIRVLSMAVVV